MVIRKAGLHRLEIVGIKLGACEVKASIVTRDGDGPASEMRVKYLFPRLRVVVEQPFVECYWLLGWVDFPKLVLTVSTKASMIKAPAGSRKRCPSKFPIGKVMCWLVLVPKNKVCCISQIFNKIIRSLNYLIF